jgi:hypothetical protein
MADEDLQALAEAMLEARLNGETVDEYTIEEGDTKRRVVNAKVQDIIAAAKYAGQQAALKKGRSIIRMIPE